MSVMMLATLVSIASTIKSHSDGLIDADRYFAVKSAKIVALVAELNTDYPDSIMQKKDLADVTKDSSDKCKRTHQCDNDADVDCFP